MASYIFYMSALAWFKQDETEAVHTAWKILHGELIYIDFFQHHHPLLYVYLAPVIALFGEHASTVVACRIAILPFFFGIVAATWLLAGRLFDRPTALVAAACLTMSWPFLYFATQIRPDVPEAMLGMFALVLLFPRGTRQASSGEESLIQERLSQSDPSPVRSLLIGILLGVSFLFLQKAIFYLAAVTLVYGARIYRREGRWAALGALWAGFVLAILPFGMWLIARGMVREYFFLNWTLNAHCLDRFSFLPHAWVILETQPAVCLFAVVGLVAVFLKRDGREFDRRCQDLALVMAILVGQVIVAPAPYLHYWIPALPLVAIFASRGMVWALARRPLILAVILGLSAFIPLIVNVVIREWTNRERLAEIDYVLREAGPEDPVYDGDILFNVFRKDVDYFWFSLADWQMLGSYRNLRPYELDICDRIEKRKPKIISTYKIDDLGDPRIRDHYTKSKEHPELMIRTR
jgi:4-amino-4-deoxy-L-arabinose transferase-like glycosyltransferase